MTTATGFPISGSLDANIQPLLSGVKWGGGLGSGATLTYSFPQWIDGATPVYVGDQGGAYGSGEPAAATVYGLNGAQQVAAEMALQSWAGVASISYAMVADTAAAYGDVRFAFTSLVRPNDPEAAAWAAPPGAYASSGDVWLATYSLGAVTDWGVGSVAFWVLLHEIGHSLGLRHPFIPELPTLPAELNHQGYTVMAYTSPRYGTAIVQAENGQGHQTLMVFPDGPMVGDIAAIQYLYGANTSYRNGDDVYTFEQSPFYRTIWDAGGNDTISIANFAHGSKVDLRPGHYSNLMMPQYADPGTMERSFLPELLYNGTENLGIAYGATIENAIGGMGNDYLIGNSANNKLTGWLGDDALEGLDGIDTATYSGARAAYALSTAGENLLVHDSRGLDGQDILARVERLQFADMTVAVDLQGNAGAVAKILGAVFGANAVANANLVGLGLKFADTGMSFAQLTRLALDHSPAGAVPSNTALVDLLYTNVIGVAPSAATQKNYVDMLAAGTYDQVGLAMMAAETAENATHIGLVGLAANGLPFLQAA